MEVRKLKKYGRGEVESTFLKGEASSIKEL